MKALRLYAGPTALRRIREHGLQPDGIRDWNAAARASVQLAYEFAHWVQAPDLNALQPL